MKINQKGAALVIGLVIVFILSILGAAVISRSISERQLVQKYSESTQAFWLAEAAINKTLDYLKATYVPTGTIGNTSLVGVDGSYSADIVGDDATPPDSNIRVVTGYGHIPATGPYRVERSIEAKVIKFEPPHFFDNAIYTAGNVIINSSGQAPDISGNVRYGGSITNPECIHDGSGIPDPSISPLAKLSFEQLREISKGQTATGRPNGNYHDATQLNGPFPTSFWYEEPSEENPYGTPNIVFLEGNLDLSGKTLVGGFYVVGGEVTCDTTLGGNVAVDGSIYTRGTFTIDGGGNALNINGGVWSSQTVLNGGVDVQYNYDYMEAIRNLGIAFDVQIISWRDTQNPYLLTP